MTSRLSRLVYICSSGRSGSTLLNMMLGSHPEFFCIGEIEHLPKNVALDTHCSCGNVVSACPFWIEVFALMHRRHGIDILTAPYAFELGLLKAARIVDSAYQTRSYLLKRKILLGIKLAEYLYGLRVVPSLVLRGYEQRLTNSFQLFEAVAEVSGRGGLVDSSKQYGRAVSLYQRSPDKVRLLLLVRDGRAVFNAALRYGLTPSASLRFWKTYYERALPVLQGNVPVEHWHTLKYEDLVSMPEATLGHVCNFLGVDYDSAMLDFRAAPTHILNGNDMRKESDSRIKLDERWKQQLNPEEVAFFEQHGGRELNARLGYS